MFQDDEKVISGMICTTNVRFEFVADEEDYRLVTGFEAKRKETQPALRGRRQRARSNEVLKMCDALAMGGSTWRKVTAIMFLTLE